jgi:hypothetical protein
MHAGHFIAVCAACLLAACSGAPRTEIRNEPTTTTVPAPAPVRAVAPRPKSVRPDVRDSVRAEPAPEPAADMLIGLTPDAVDKLLGGAELVRQDGTAEIRLYRSRDQQCTFHVFLYASSGADQSSVVEYFEARNKNGRLEGADMQACYRALVKPAATS